MNDATKTVSFGYRDVAPEEKPALIRGVFSSVASRYDLMNDLMSAGVHRLWKDSFVDWLNPQPGWSVLDVAGGTGDVAFCIYERLRPQGGAAKITLCDLNEDMLKQGRRRAQANDPTIIWLCGDAEALPVEAGSQDAYTIAFGIRNTTHLDQALGEAYRVLKP